MALALLSNHIKKHTTRKMGAEQSSPNTSPSSSRSRKCVQATGPCDVIAIVRSDRKKDKFRELLHGLVYNGGDVNASGEHGMTALHYAVLKKDELMIKTLIAFGANCCARNDFKQTPLDVAIENRIDNLIPLLVSVGCKSGSMFDKPSVGLYYRTNQSSDQSPHIACNELSPVEGGLRRAKHMLSDQLEEHMRLTDSTSIGLEEAYAFLLQKRELERFRDQKCDSYRDSATPPSVEFASRGGARILSLDGGGMRGVIELEILNQIEKLTGKRITELFDWIIGNSTGAIIALGLVYANKSIDDLRKMVFQMKDEVFGKRRGLSGYNTKAMEAILQQEFGTKRMSDCTQPRVIVTAVDKSNTPMNIHYFNNCFNDEFSTQPVWKVARYTSAAPLYFSELDNYVDGGVMANNPCEGGLAKIRSFYQSHSLRIPIACMVSVGSGAFPPDPLGHISIFGGMNNLFRMLGDALGQSEATADRCKTSCDAQDIPFYRFSPMLEKKIEPTETDSRKLVDLMISSHMYMCMEEFNLDKLIPILLQVAGTDSTPAPPILKQS